jgi:hypothetical protein
LFRLTFATVNRLLKKRVEPCEYTETCGNHLDRTLAPVRQTDI